MPVLSRSFIGVRERRRRPRSHRRPRCRNAPPAAMWPGTELVRRLAQARHVRRRLRMISSPNASTLRANPYPEVTDPICRFPLPTFIYRLEAVHLGDLMRISVRASANVQKRNPPTEFSRASRERPRTPRKRGALRDRLFNSVYPKPSRSTTEFQGLGPSSRKENSSRGSRQLLRFVSRYRDRVNEDRFSRT